MPATGYAPPDLNFMTQLRSNKVRGTHVVNYWFDRSVVLRQLSDKTQKVLSRFGYFTMRNARQSIRKRKRPSRAGESPTNWPAFGSEGLLKKFIFFEYDPHLRSVVIGPALLASPTARRRRVPLVLEEGGLVYPVEGKRPTEIEPRPYMEPAFQRQLKKQMPALWGKL